MTVTDWLMIAAVFLGPIVAVRLTRYLDNQKEIKERKVDIFKTLMATRAYTVSWLHVEALNQIDLEFDSNREREVIEAWKAYHDLLKDVNIPIEQWESRRVDLLVDLLHKMAIVLGYDFDKTHIKNSSYAPRAHGDTEMQQTVLRKQLIEVLAGKRSVPISINTQQQGGQRQQSVADDIGETRFS